MNRKLLTLSFVALSLAAAAPALALNPQPEPPNMPRISIMRMGPGPDHFSTRSPRIHRLPPSPVRRR